MPSFDILHFDRHLLVVAKPARLLTAGDATGDDTLLARVREWHQRELAGTKKGFLAPVHFLDRPVSGAVMFALSSKAAARLAAAFKASQIHKTYHALVECRAKHAALSSEPVLAEDWLLKDTDRNLVTVVPKGTPAAKACALTYRLLTTPSVHGGGRAPLEVRPRTGRSHQIRVQLSSRGLSIYGDVKYGASVPWQGGAIALHARRLELAHPVGGAPLSITCPYPSGWSDIWPDVAGDS